LEHQSLHYDSDVPSHSARLSKCQYHTPYVNTNTRYITALNIANKHNTNGLNCLKSEIRLNNMQILSQTQHNASTLGSSAG